VPDRRQHRGAHPDDQRLFAESTIPALRVAVRELSWLLSRDYAIDSSIKLVGDRHDLTARQRLAVRRCACSDQQVTRRQKSLLPACDLRGRAIGVDGYNLLITVESALSGGAIFVGCDGCYRDRASVHGTYRKVVETGPALDVIFAALAELHPMRIDWFLDRPVSNSGRLRAFMLERLEKPMNAVGFPLPSVILVDSPDATLRSYEGVVATSDSAVLDRCAAWTNLAARVIDMAIPTAWKIDLRPPRDGLTCSSS